MRIIATSALNRLNSRAAKAAKPALPKTPIVESNRALYKIGTRPQPQRDACLQRCIEVTVPINGVEARVLLDGGSNTNIVIKLASGLLFFLPLPYLVAVFSLLYTTLLYLGAVFSLLYITLHYWGTLFLTLLYMCALYGGRW